MTLPDHAVVRPAGDSAALGKRLAPLLDPPVEFFKADAGDGVMVDGYVIKPPAFDPAKRYPVLVNIYGEPASQTVADAWGGSGVLYHRYLASLGYLVVSFDNAGTPAPRGRAWRKAVYGAVGVLSSKQQAAALRSLNRTPSVRRSRSRGVWGWSGGGTNTLNLMFRYPELYKVGHGRRAGARSAAVRHASTRSATWACRRRTPTATGRARPSTSRRASTGNLLIVHGSGDDNVHYQGTQLLVNRLDRARKAVRFHDLPGPHPLDFGGAGHDRHLFGC